MTLVELQRQTMEAVTRPLTAGYGMRARTPDGKSMYAEAATFIKPNDRLSSFERLEIYNRQYWFRLLGSLSDDFPALAALLGEKRFERLCVEYLQAQPSRSFTLRNLGSELSAWLPSYQEEMMLDRQLLVDVATLEWAHIEAFDNAELPPVTTERVSAVAEHSKLGLQPHLRLLQLQYPVDHFVVDIHHDEDEPGMASNAVKSPPAARKKRFLSKLQRQPLYLAVHRHQEWVYYKRLDRGAYEILTRLATAVPLADALEQALSVSEDEHFVENIPAWFANWGELGWLVDSLTTQQWGNP